MDSNRNSQGHCRLLQGDDHLVQFPQESVEVAPPPGLLDFSEIKIIRNVLSRGGCPRPVRDTSANFKIKSMKFGTDFKRSGRKPTWTYNGLKRVLGDVTRYKQSVQLSPPLRNLQRTASYRSVRGFYGEPIGYPRVDANEKVIDIDALQSNASGRYYVTNFLRQLEGGGEIEVRFFRMLDEELNKVNTFFKKKVKEVMQEANTLNKQIDALVALRIKVERPDYDGSSSETPSNGGACTESTASNDIKDQAKFTR